uniref:Uncharacterized protein n=1 Tax=Panagrolaimus sp. ES5 TaxID=591445 RepID=A0AC34FTT3_9BILA
MTKTPLTPKYYKNVIHTCKYFFVKNPILIFHILFYNNKDGWTTFINGVKISADLKNVLSKLWMTEEICVFGRNEKNKNIVSSIIPKIYKCDLTELKIEDQDMSFGDLKTLSSNVKKLVLREVIVMYKNGSTVPFEKIVAVFKKLQILFYLPHSSTSSTITPTTLKELLKIPHFLTLEFYELWDIPVMFDIETFYSYIKENKDTKIHLKFSHTISQEHKNQLQALNDEIRKTKLRNYLTFSISFL